MSHALQWRGGKKKIKYISQPKKPVGKAHRMARGAGDLVQGIPASTCTSFVFFYCPFSASCRVLVQSLIPPLDKKTFCRPSPALGNAGLQPEKSAEEEFGSRAGVEVIFFFCLQKQSLGHQVLTQLFQQLRLRCHLGQIRLKSHVLVLPGLTLWVWGRFVLG